MIFTVCFMTDFSRNIPFCTRWLDVWAMWELNLMERQIRLFPQHTELTNTNIFVSLKFENKLETVKSIAMKCTSQVKISIRFGNFSQFSYLVHVSQNAKCVWRKTSNDMTLFDCSVIKHRIYGQILHHERLFFWLHNASKWHDLQDHTSSNVSFWQRKNTFHFLFQYRKHS